MSSLYSMLYFNHRGFLVPNNAIKSTVKELKSYFVDEIGNDKRKILYDKYIRYSDDLKGLISNTELRQWIDGSFVTKKAEPGDIDVVTFIDGEIIERIGEKLTPFKFPASVEQYGVDAYLVPVYGWSSKGYPLFVADNMYWLDAFDKSQRSRTGIRHPKGFLEIIY